MNNDKLISVIIPLYNSAATIEKCLDSILAQKYGKLEILCVDDGSTDSTPEILRRYEARDGRVRVITQQNAGAGAARNTGLRACRGDYLSFLDSDDFFEQDMYVRMLKAMTKHDADICVCSSDLYHAEADYYFRNRVSLRYEYLPDKEVFSADDIPGHLFNVFNGYPWNKLFKAGFVASAGLSFQEIENFNDIFFVNMALALADRITVTPEILIHKTVKNEGSLSESGNKNFECSYMALSKIKNELVARGVYDKLKQSFVNRAVNSTIFNINIVRGANQKAYFYSLKESWLEELDMIGHPDDYYYDAAKYEELRVIERGSFDEYLMYLVDKYKKKYDKYMLRLARHRRKSQKLARALPFAAKVYRKVTAKTDAGQPSDNNE
jgi:glycosyltransferase involved in cell wall biosynthesis